MERNEFVERLYEKAESAVCRSSVRDGYIEDVFLYNGNSFWRGDIEEWVNEFDNADDLRAVMEKNEEFINDPYNVELKEKSKEVIKEFNELMEKYEVDYCAFSEFDIHFFDIEDYVINKAVFLANQYSDKVDAWLDEFEKVCELVKPIQKAYGTDEITEKEALEKFREIISPLKFDYDFLEEFRTLELFGDELTRFLFCRAMQETIK